MENRVIATARSCLLRAGWEAGRDGFALRRGFSVAAAEARALAAFDRNRIVAAPKLPARRQASPFLSCI